MPDLSKVSVLVVDDNGHMIYILRSLLLGFGITRTFESRYAAEAVELTRRESIDLIILDYQMPFIDGLEFTRTIRTSEKSRNPFVPIILVTAHTERSRIIEARDAGVTEICAKPINAHQLWTKIAAVVNHPRPFIRSDGFFGPDRRRMELEFGGDERRTTPVDMSGASVDAA